MTSLTFFWQISVYNIVGKALNFLRFFITFEYSVKKIRVFIIMLSKKLVDYIPLTTLVIEKSTWRLGVRRNEFCIRINHLKPVLFDEIIWILVLFRSLNYTKQNSDSFCLQKNNIVDLSWESHTILPRFSVPFCVELMI